MTFDFPIRCAGVATHDLPLSPLSAERGLLPLKGRRAGQRNSTRLLPCLYLRIIRRPGASDCGKGISAALREGGGGLLGNVDGLDLRAPEDLGPPRENRRGAQVSEGGPRSLYRHADRRP